MVLTCGSQAAFALDAKVAELRTASSAVSALIELRNVFTPTYRDLLEKGRTLYLSIETEFWEDRPAWDRLVGPSRAVTFNLVAGSAGQQVTVTASAGGTIGYPKYPDPLLVRVDVAAADRVEDGKTYYLHAIASIGTLAQRELDDAGDTVFGSDRESTGLAALGKLVFRKVMKMSDYLQSVTAEVTSRKVTGRQIKGGS